MRHGKKVKKLGRNAAHRKATLMSLSNALIAHKRITTTFAKAKALRGFVEPLINRAKDDTMHNRRQVFRYLRDKESVKELFGNIADKVGDRNGGYTRVIKLGRRQGDGAELAIVELVDYNDIKPVGSRGAEKRKRTRRGSRRRAKPEKAATAVVAEEVVEAVSEEVAEVEEELDEAAATTEAAEDEPAEEPVTEVAKEEPTAEVEVDVVEAAEEAEPVAEEAEAVQTDAVTEEAEAPEAVDESEAEEEAADDDEEKKD